MYKYFFKFSKGNHLAQRLEEWKKVADAYYQIALKKSIPLHL